MDYPVCRRLFYEYRKHRNAGYDNAASRRYSRMVRTRVLLEKYWKNQSKTAVMVDTQPLKLTEYTGNWNDGYVMSWAEWFL
jgi:hypothetical protein